MPHYDWSQVPAEQLNPQVTRRAIHTPAITVARLNMAKGTIVPAHQHVNEQFTMVESGALRFNLGGQELILRPGEALAIPSEVPHGVEALEDTVIIDFFTPRRQDWIDGNDAYLRK